MNCPKCGFAQEERSDCIKCGVVFAKFFALHHPESPQPAEAVDPHLSDALACDETDQAVPTLLHELRLDVPTLKQRFHELEFERAERRRLQNEVRAFGEQLRKGLEHMTARQEDFERRLAGHAEAAAIPHEITELASKLHAIDLDAIQARIGQMESRICSSAQELARLTDSRLLELIPRLDARLVEAETRTQALVEAKARSLGDGTATQLDDATRGLEELRSALQAVSVRYAEIGDLKKNHLVLRDQIESLQHEQEVIRKACTNGITGKVAALEQEVSALRAEMRNGYERMTLLERQNSQEPPVSPAPLEGLLALRDEIGVAGRHVDEKMQRLETTVGALNEELIQAQSQIQAVQANINESGPCPIRISLPQSQEELRAIRENLEEIRRFMCALAPR